MKVSSKMNVVDVVSVQDNHRQFVPLLEDHETEHSDIDYHTADRGFSLGKLLKRNGIRGRNFESFVRR